jgi:hypothetical protein
MKYTFELLGVSPILYFFNQQQELTLKHPHKGVEYLGSYKCTLDAFIESVETVPSKTDWNFDEVIDTMVNFWLNNSDLIQFWKIRLDDAGKENLLVARVADINGLRHQLEYLLK